MSFSLEIFKKPLKAVRPEDVVQFFAEARTENQHLEFKSGEVRVEKLLKEISAFLNAEGGLLIIGAPREVESGRKTEERYCSGEPEPSQDLTADILREKIREGIEPLPTSLALHDLDYRQGKIILAEVKPSHNPPHQVQANGKYYLRDGAISRPARHAEIEKMFFKNRLPEMRLRIELERPYDAVKVKLTLENITTAVSEEPGYTLEIFPVRNVPAQRLKAEQIMKGKYLAKGESWQTEEEVLPASPRFFMSCRYFAKNNEPKLKAAFAEISKKDIELLQVFNSESDLDFDWWYEQWKYLLEE